MIFFSYSWVDANVARALYKKFSDAGHPRWIDFERLDLNRPIEPQLLRAVTGATIVLMLDSQAARRSPWVHAELKWAAQARVPILIQPTEYVAERMRSNSDVEAGGFLAVRSRIAALL